jgi:hypothetical protein
MAREIFLHLSVGNLGRLVVSCSEMTSGQNPFPKNECQVFQSNISRRGAGSWSIWFPWSFSCVWFDEPERQDRPAHQIDRL